MPALALASSPNRPSSSSCSQTKTLRYFFGLQSQLVIVLIRSPGRYHRGGEGCVSPLVSLVTNKKTGSQFSQELVTSPPHHEGCRHTLLPLPLRICTSQAEGCRSRTLLQIRKRPHPLDLRPRTSTGPGPGRNWALHRR